MAAGVPQHIFTTLFITLLIASSPFPALCREYNLHPNNPPPPPPHLSFPYQGPSIRSHTHPFPPPRAPKTIPSPTPPPIPRKSFSSPLTFHPLILASLIHVFPPPPASFLPGLLPSSSSSLHLLIPSFLFLFSSFSLPHPPLISPLSTPIPTPTNPQLPPPFRKIYIMMPISEACFMGGVYER